MTRQARDSDAQSARLWASDGAATEALLELARTSVPVEPAVQLGSEERFMSAFRSVSARKPRRVIGHWSGLAAAVLALAALTTGFLLFRRGAPPARADSLSYRVSDDHGPAGTEIDAAGGPVDVRFSDGTDVTVERGARARVLETTPRGAHLCLLTGRAAFEVVPHAERGDWSVDAGPFRVRVTGTAFTVEWNAADGFFQVEVSRGHVVVEGEGQRRELGAGEAFRSVAPPSAEQPRKVAAEELAPESAERGSLEPAHPPVTPTPHERPSSPSWARLVAAGRFDAVIDAAEERGASACLEACSLIDLQAWADAARLQGQAALAERVLLSERARFVGSAESRAAAFVLGRLAESGRTDRALQWYEAYLAESPQGRFASDALGRSMVLTAAVDRARALPFAERYLLRFPAGAYADHARNLIEAAGHLR